MSGWPRAGSWCLLRWRLAALGVSCSELGSLSGADQSKRGGGAVGADSRDDVKVAGADLALVLGGGVATGLSRKLQLHMNRALSGLSVLLHQGPEIAPQANFR